MNMDSAAVTKIKEIMAEENDPGYKLRVFVQGGGCSGFTQGFTLDKEQNEDDFELKFDEVTVLVDAMSWQYLQDAEILYTDDISGSGFVLKNPAAKSTCGCGSSFSV